MNVVRTANELREFRAAATGSVGLVPTMGAFHDGPPLALPRRTRGERPRRREPLRQPAQFGAGEDLARYPRDEARDARAGRGDGVDILFVPPFEEMYPPGFQTWVDVERARRRSSRARTGPATSAESQPSA